VWLGIEWAGALDAQAFLLVQSYIWLQAPVCIPARAVPYLYQATQPCRQVSTQQSLCQHGSHGRLKQIGRQVLASPYMMMMSLLRASRSRGPFGLDKHDEGCTDRSATPPCSSSSWSFPSVRSCDHQSSRAVHGNWCLHVCGIVGSLEGYKLALF
jgi:hypothetical protein